VNKVKLKSISKQISSGLTPSRSNPDYWVNGEIFWLKTEQLGEKYIYETNEKITSKAINETSIKLYPKGTLSIAMYGEGRTRGNVSIIHQEMTTNQACCNIVLDPEKACYEYVYYYLKTQYSNLRSLSSGVRKNLNSNDIKEFEITLPNSLKDQQRVAAILSTLDDKIALNNQINSELEQVAKTLYDYWFVQFDFPDANDKPYKSSGGKMQYNEVLKREVPEGWKVGSFADWIKETKTGDWGKEIENGNYTQRVFCVRGADINGINGKGEVKAPERFILKNNASKALLPNDFVIEISGGSPTQSTGRIALVSNKVLERFDAPVICSNFCKAVTLKDEKYAFNFQQEWQRLYNAKIFFGFEGKTSGIKNFLFDSFVSSYQVTIPPKVIAEKFYNFAESIEFKKQTNLLENQQLADLRDWLLPMLMNGQVKVSDSDLSDMVDLSMAAEPQMSYGQAEPLNIPANKKAFAKQVLAGKIVSTFVSDPNFTDIKFQKVQFLAEHLIQADLNLNYYYQAAGPYDNKFMHSIYDDFRKQRWFDYKNRQLIPLEKQEKIEGYFQGYFASAKEYLDWLFDILFPITEADAEIIATLYAVWNNRIIEAHQTTDDELIADFYQWSDRKKQYSKSQVENGLKFLIKNQITPRGFGQVIKRAKNKR